MKSAGMERVVAAAALAALSLGFIAPASAKEELLETGNLRMIGREAQLVLNRTSAVCLNAGCVNGECKPTNKLWMSLYEARSLLERAEEPLRAWRKLHLDLALSDLETARLDRDRIDRLRDLQLLQDSLQAVATAASEAASWGDFILKYKEKSGKWWDFWSTRSNEQFYAFLKHTKDHLSRLNAILKYPSIGKDRRQKIGGMDIAKFSAEVSQYLVDIGNHLEDGKGWKHADTRQSIGKLLIKVGDLLVKIDRRARQGRIDEYIQSETAAHAHAAGLLKTARAVNEQLAVIATTKRKLDEARRALSYCAHRICSAREASRLPSPPKGPEKPKKAAKETVKPGAAARLLQQLRQRDRDIIAVLHKMQEAAGKAAIRADTRSKVVLADASPFPGTPIEANYELSRCVPEDAHFLVHRLPFREGAKPLLDLGRPAKSHKGISKGRLAFRIFPDLSGKWTDADGKQYLIRVRKGTEMELVWKGMPVKSRDRTYSGRLKSYSEPGKYRLALHSAKTGKTFFPLTIDVKRPGGSFRKAFVLKSTPRAMADLNPALPKKVRAQILRDPLRTELSYLAEVRPQLAKDGSLRLAVDFQNYAFKWLGRDPGLKIYRPTIRKKSQRKTVLLRVQ